MSDEPPKCEKHKRPLIFDDCIRCAGEGYTEFDLEELEDPLAFGNGDCFECKGSGVSLYMTCPDCEQEAYEEIYYEE